MVAVGRGLLLAPAQINIVSTAATHTPLSIWVNRCVSIEALRQPLSVVGPIGDKIVRRGERSDVPIATNAPQKAAFLFDRFVGKRGQRWRALSWSP
jgi:hypothetical protein